MLLFDPYYPIKNVLLSYKIKNIMKDSFIYLKNLFYNKDQKLSKKDFITIVSLMWMLSTCTIASFLHLIPSSFLASKKGITFLASHSIFSSFSSLVFNISVPWFFIALILSVLLGNKLYGNIIKKKFLIIGIGFFLWMFFTILPLVPFFFFSIGEFYEQNLTNIENEVLLMKILLGTFAAIGGGLFFKSMFKTRAKEIYSDVDEDVGLNRGEFSRSMLYVQFVFWLLSYFLIIIFIKPVDDDVKLLSYIVYALFIMMTIIQLYLMAQRLINIGKSPFILLYLLLCGLIVATTIYLLNIIKSIFPFYIMSKFFDVLVIVINLFYISFFIYPDKKITKKLNYTIGS